MNISGNANTISLTGDCGVVQVYGTDHKVSLGTATALEISGMDISVSATSVARLMVDTAVNRVSGAVVGDGQTAIVEIDGAEHELTCGSTGPFRSP